MAIKASEKVLVLNAVQQYRKKLKKKAIMGLMKFRVFGSGKNWYIAVDTGEKVVRLTSGKVFNKMGNAIAFVFSKYGQKATQFKGQFKTVA